jgi:septation ring formation regulator EzrA
MENKKPKIKKDQVPKTPDSIIAQFENYRDEIEKLHNRKSDDEIDLKALEKLSKASNKILRELNKLDKETSGNNTSKKKSQKKD